MWIWGVFFVSYNPEIWHKYSIWAAVVEEHYLHFDFDVLPCGYELIQRLLGILHVAAVLPIYQQPG